MLLPLQDGGVEDAIGLSTRGHEGYRRVLVLLMLDVFFLKPGFLLLVLLHEESFRQG